MTEEQFREFTEEVIPQQLYHVMGTDLDDDTGAKLDEVILVGLIANRPSCLKHKSLQWFLDTFIHSFYKEMEKENSKLMKNLSKVLRNIILNIMLKLVLKLLGDYLTQKFGEDQKEKGKAHLASLLSYLGVPPAIIAQISQL